MRPDRRVWRLAALLVGLTVASADAAPGRVLRVCADPNNLPFSDENGDGFENRLAQMLARELGARVEYTWWAQRRGAIRNTLKAGLCDVTMGVPTTLDMAAVSKPYYTSSYVFVSRSERQLDIESFDDPRLRQLVIGVQVVGDDGVNTPPVHALSGRDIVDNVRGYSVLGDYARRSPAATVIEAVQSGDVDLAIVWGPLAGYFARQPGAHLRVQLVPARDGALPMRFDIGMGVRHADKRLLAEIEAFIVHRRRAIDELLASYGVPRP